MKHSACIGVGSNIEPRKHVTAAEALMRQTFSGFRASRFVMTPPIGSLPQADFLNGAFALETDWTRERLNAWLKETETMLGRERTADRYGPRTIDLDIVVWDDRIIDRDFYDREFLKRAVLELFPDLRY